MHILFKRFSIYWFVLLTLTFLIVISPQAFAQDAISQIPVANDLFSAVNTIWMLMAALLVFFMNAGFALLEAGICHTDTTNRLSKKLLVFCVSAMAFFIFGFRLMFGDSSNPVFGQLGLFINSLFPSEINQNPFPQGFENLRTFWGNRSFAAIFLLQLSFAVTAATIVSGAIAERIKFRAFILFSFVFVGFIYPLMGYWVRSEHGWLASSLNFHDFAGSTVIHCVGGTAALVGTWLLNPRAGKFGYDASTDSFPYGLQGEKFESCNPGFTTLGCLILWIGWFGINGGSTRFLDYVPHVIMTTMFAATAGGLVSLLYSLLATEYKVKLSSIINGILGGLVSITASSAYVSILDACIIGAVGGILVAVGGSLLRSHLIRIDDPVNVIPIHLFCGVWGTVAVGLFAHDFSLEFTRVYPVAQQTLYQLLGCGCVVASTFLLSLLAWGAIGLWLCYLRPGGSQSSQGAVDLFALIRRGLRIPLKDEKAGSNATIIP